MLKNPKQKSNETTKISAMLYFKLIDSNWIAKQLIHFVVCNSFEDVFARNLN